MGDDTAMTVDGQRPRSGPRPCAKLVLAVFGSLFLISLLSVPVTTSSSKTRQDQGSLLVVRTTYPRKGRMFLPAYLTMGREARQARGVIVRTTEWVVPLAIMVLLGVVDYFIICRLLWRPGPEELEAGRGPGDGFGLGL